MADKRTKGRDIQAASVSNDWLTQLAQNLELQPAPSGWYTLSEVAVRLRIGRTAARTILAQRKAKKQKFYHKTVDGRMIPTTHYKL